jgi:hypothetical protein
MPALSASGASWAPFGLAVFGRDALSNSLPIGLATAAMMPVATRV